MQNVMGNARQSVEACRIIKVSRDRHHTALAQLLHTRAVVSQAENAVAIAQ